MLRLNDFLERNGAAPEKTFVFRHQPFEPQLKRAFPFIVGSDPKLFDAYQVYQNETLERVLKAHVGGWVASLMGYGPRKAILIGFYQIAAFKDETRVQFRSRPENQKLLELGNSGFPDDDPRAVIARFDLRPVELQQSWQGKLVVGWPPPELRWWRRAHNNEMPILAIREESYFERPMDRWEKLRLTWQQLGLLPNSWKAALSHWRGIYLIWDQSDGRSYVGSASGEMNMLGRWQNYADTGHGGNKRLRARDPKNFHFSILQRVSPDMEVSEIVQLENSWKQRLHTIGEFGLNEA